MRGGGMKGAWHEEGHHARRGHEGGMKGASCEEGAMEGHHARRGHHATARCHVRRGITDRPCERSTSHDRACILRHHPTVHAYR
jgi:hypothetical protein